MTTDSSTYESAPSEGYLRIARARLYVREIGHGQPIIVLHGGRDFDHTYLLPELDHLADGYRLITYDQRGRGRSGASVRPDEVTLLSEMEDLDAVRKHFQLDRAALLGHSWGGLLAMEYAIRHPEHVSHLILMNTAPASHDDLLFFRAERRKTAFGDMEQLAALRNTARYQEGDLETEADYYRIHFGTTLRQPEHLQAVVSRLRAHFTKDGVVKARAIEERLYHETWLSSDYDLQPALSQLTIPTLVIHGEQDLIPVACAVRIAEAVPRARFVLLPDCGHFSYLECPEAVRSAIENFFAGVDALRESG